MSSETLIELRGGLVIPYAVIELGCALERAGWTLSRVGDKLSVGRSAEPDKDPDKPDKLTDDEKMRIRKYKDHLLAVVDLKYPLPVV